MGVDIFRDLRRKSSIWELVSSLVAAARSKQPEHPRLFFFFNSGILCFFSSWNLEQRSPTLAVLFS